jgi:osmotically-inducible protein OsmY
LSCDSDGGITVEVEPVFRPTPVAVDDDAIAEALRMFVCALGPAAAEVRLEFHAGVATLVGAVSSATQQQTVEDLVAAHEAVERVVSELRVVAGGGVIAF